MTEQTTEELEPVDDRGLVGQVLDGRYRLDGFLDKGGMGVVYRGTQLSINRRVAIKIIRRGPHVPESMEQRFFREAQVMSQFSHPNIVQLIDFGRTADDVLYLAMEFVEGETLDAVRAGGRFDPGLVAEILRQSCLGLAEAHAHGIVHRDLKTSNLVISFDASGHVRVRILDFGIAYPRNHDVKITKTGLLCGTPAYLAPEQARDKEIDHRADIYSLGVVGYELLAGRLPFTGATMQVMFKHVHEPPPSLQPFVSTGIVPPGLISILDRMLEKSPANRPNSAAEVARELASLNLAKPAIHTLESLKAHCSEPLNPDRASREERLQKSAEVNSAPFVNADDEVKGAWEAFLATGGGDDAPASYDPNLDYLDATGSAGLDMDPYVRPDVATAKFVRPPESDVDGDIEMVIPDSIRNLPPPRTGRLAALRPQEVEQYSPEPAPVQQQPAQPAQQAPQPLERQPIGAARPTADVTYSGQVSKSRAWLPLAIVMVVVVVLGAAVMWIQSKRFAPEEDTLTGEDWEEYRKQKLEEELNPNGNKETDEVSEPEPAAKTPKKKRVKPTPKTKKAKKKPIDLWDNQNDSEADPFEIEAKE